MESLIRLSGILPEDDDGRTDLGTLEKRLAHKTTHNSGTPEPSRNSDAQSSTSRQNGFPSHRSTPIQPGLPSPASGVASPEPPTTTEANGEDDALAEMMCSLVTNNCGETRYIGMRRAILRSGSFS
jgi:hypothetical protein